MGRFFVWFVLVGIVVCVAGFCVTLTAYWTRSAARVQARAHPYPALLPEVPSVDFKSVCISLPRRHAKYVRLQRLLKPDRVDLRKFPAVDGRHLDPKTYPHDVIAPSFKHHLALKPHHIGNLGATFSHLHVWHRWAERGGNRVLLVCEDDMIPVSGFRAQVEDRLARLRASKVPWDVLLLGFTCGYDAYHKCHANDGLAALPPLAVQGGLVRVKYFMGLWGYMLNGARAARRIVGSIYPQTCCIDHRLSQVLAKGDIQAVGCVPALAFHPGVMPADSWGYIAKQSSAGYVSDTRGQHD